MPLALGGAGITLRDLSGALCCLGHRRFGGEPPLLPPLRRHRRRAIPAAAGRRGDRGGADAARCRIPACPAIAWKTGTSWGGRDSWALGFDRSHVVGAWVGRPDGTPLPGATGRSLALPLVARVFEILPAAPRESPPVGQRAIAGSRSASYALRLLFPPPNAVVSGDGPVTLRAMGGQRPLTFLMNGAPLQTDPARREISWVPPAPGFYRLTVLDIAGGVARVSLQVK